VKPGAHVDTTTVRQLAVALRRYVDSAGAMLNQVRWVQGAIADELAEAIAQRRAAQRRAEDDLRSCQADPEASCSVEAQTLRRAEQKLTYALQARQIFSEGSARHAMARIRYDRAVIAINSDSQAALSVIGQDLETYLGGSGRLSSGATGSTGSAGSVGSNDSGGPANGTIGTGFTTPAGFPPGIAMVPLSMIDQSDSQVNGPADFGKGYSPADLAWAFEDLRTTIMPAIARGKGLDYFRDRDVGENRHGTRRHSDTYQGFLGSDAPRVSRQPGGTFCVENGNHRIWVARQLGLDAVPARVVG
jgi:hypothetical protein